MLDIKLIRENYDAVYAQLARRGSGVQGDLEDLGRLLEIDKKLRNNLYGSHNLRAAKKLESEKIGELKKGGQDASEPMGIVKAYNDQLKELEVDIKVQEEKLRAILLKIPNLPDASVPDGADESANKFVRDDGQAPKFDFQPKNHLELGESLGLLDLKRAAKIAGTRFAVFKGQGAALLRALIQFMLDTQTRENGYVEMYPPVLVNEESLIGTGQLPKFKEDLFKLNDDPYYLIPTAEVPVTNYHRDEILKAEDLPIRYAAYTLCFRREAGSYGKDTQGIIRQHQFDKVELVQFVQPEQSYELLETLVTHAESILKKLNLHYRVVELCAGDLGFSVAKTYDLEVWLPSQNTYREISSCSNFTDYQARRAKIRYKKKDGSKAEWVHTLNGSGLAAGRLFVAVLENYQQADGSIRVPAPLQPYLNGLDRITG